MFFFSVKQRVAPQEIDDIIIWIIMDLYIIIIVPIDMAIWEGLKLLSLPLQLLH